MNYPALFDINKVTGILNRIKIARPGSRGHLFAELEAALDEPYEGQPASGSFGLFGQPRSEAREISATDEQQIKTLQARLKDASTNPKERYSIACKLRELRGHGNLFTSDDLRNRP